jgi:hypothetical protein
MSAGIDECGVFEYRRHEMYLTVRRRQHGDRVYVPRVRRRTLPWLR